MAVRNVTDSEFEAALKENEKVIVKYFADWCGSCRLFAPKYNSLSNDEKYNGITFLEVDAENEEQARKAGGVDNLPFFSIFSNGKLVEGTTTSKEETVTAMLETLKAQ